MPKNYIYADLSGSTVMFLIIDHMPYAISQFSMTHAVNEMPQATCLLAVGRHAKSGEAAMSHQQQGHKQMTPATVVFNPQGDFDIDVPWPVGHRVIFRGFFCGFAYRKALGKINVVANLIHWLAALDASSCVTSIGHVSNPTKLNAAAVLGAPGATTGRGGYISLLAASTAVNGVTVYTDLWAAIKGLFCTLAQVPTAHVGPATACGGNGSFQTNDFALNALNKIEGPVPVGNGANCALPYNHGVPLAMDLQGSNSIATSIANTISKESIESWSATSFWDKLLRRYCPMFGMAIVPMTDTAIVIADTPGFNGGFWREIRTTEYDSFDMTAELHRPLRAVGITASYASEVINGVEGKSDSGETIGGCWVEDSVTPGDGAIMYVAAPPWLEIIRTPGIEVGATTNVEPALPASSTTTPGANPGVGGNAQTASTTSENFNEMYKRYAHDVYITNALRGRVGSLSGKLRFDIAPGSIVKIEASAEQFIGAEDNLAVTLFGCVQRVTIAINAESGMAGTTLSISHLRSAAENTQTRTSVKAHPLFGDSIHGKNGSKKHGCPLIDDYDL